ncbi:MAG: recombinase family protein [Deltaproteobacteria bacterium]|jgi:DNA invertase Pin-like site-specific DNA recombinase|nr:recombinase family protein [Deltaproteobacteria bacterium]
MKVTGYIRVSTEDQAREGVSLEAQEGKIRAWADLNGYAEVEIFTDAGISGSSMDKREGLHAALKAVGKDDALIVYSLSRLARSTKDTLMIADKLMDQGADLVSLSEKIDTTTAAGKMVFRMLAVLAEFERDQIAERTQTALAHKKSKGERVGSIPYGFRLAEDRKHLLPDPAEQEVIGFIRECHKSCMGYNAIARMLTERGKKTRTGKDFQATQVMRILAA